MKYTKYKINEVNKVRRFFDILKTFDYQRLSKSNNFKLGLDICNYGNVFYIEYYLGSKIHRRLCWYKITRKEFIEAVE